MHPEDCGLFVLVQGAPRGWVLSEYCVCKTSTGLFFVLSAHLLVMPSVLGQL